MVLRCPVCSSTRFFIEFDDSTVFFSLHGDGTPFEVMPVGAKVVLDADTVVFCSGCAWNGTWQSLEAST